MSNEHQKYLNDVSSDKGFLVLSASFGVMSMNERAKSLFGACPEPGAPWPLEKFVAAEDLIAVNAAVRSIFEHGGTCQNLPAVMRNADGRAISCRLDLRPLVRGEHHILGALLTIEVAQPVSIPLQAVPDSNDPAARSAPPSLFDHLPKGSFTIDTQWHITAFNREAEKITGYSREEALGRPCWEIFRSETCHQQCPMRLALDRKQPELERQVMAVNRAGQRHALSVNVNLLRNPRGEIVGAVETFHPAAAGRTLGLQEPGRLHGLIGNSPIMRAIFAMLPDLAASRANVLICGESGTGKELVARTLHRMSQAADAPFVAVNCAGLPQSLIEAELFGCEKGAFTGADQSRPGRFEMAGRGCLLLDEIGELKPDLQVKLLRVIEARRFERVGGTRSIAFEGRLISATHQDLAKAIEEKRFREDLFYRLRTVTLTMPPLRRHPEDIPLLVDHFIKQFNQKTGKSVRSLDPKVMRRLMAYHWPGNVRELARCLEHAFVFVKGPVIFERHLPELDDPLAYGIGQVAVPPPADPDDRESILRALRKTGGHREAASRLLGISRTSMWRRMKQMGLQ